MNVMRYPVVVLEAVCICPQEATSENGLDGSLREEKVKQVGQRKKECACISRQYLRP